MTATIEERVARGAAWLDHERPGWRDAVALDALVMESSCKCICGQVFAHEVTIGRGHPKDGFYFAMHRFGNDNDDWAEDHGFAAHPTDVDCPEPAPSASGAAWDVYEAAARRAWIALEDEWRRVIAPARVAVPA